MITLKLNDQLTFGKYESKMVSEIVKTDPNYLLWLQKKVEYIDISDEVRDIANKYLKDETPKKELKGRFRLWDKHFDIIDRFNGLFEIRINEKTYEIKDELNQLDFKYDSNFKCWKVVIEDKDILILTLRALRLICFGRRVWYRCM